MAANNQALKILIKSAKQILHLQIERIDDLSTKDFPHYTTTKVLKLMKSIFSQILTHIEKLENDLKKAKTKKALTEIEIDLKLYTKFVFSQNETINMLEASTREKVSQNTVFLIKYLTKKFPQAKFIITSTYEHNYSIVYWGRELQKKLVNMDIDISNQPKPESFFILSFPAVLKENLVANSILGHELGHFIIQDQNLLAGTTKPEVKYNKKFKKLVEQKVKDVKKEQHIPENIAKQEIENRYNKSIKEQVTFGMEEILSDLIGFQLFGPVMLLALNEFLLIDRPSHKIGSLGHPPASLRLSILIDELNSMKYLEQIKDGKIKKEFRQIVNSIKSYIKPTNLSVYQLEDEIKLDAWKSIISKLKKIARKATKGNQYNKKRFSTDLPILVNKLAELIPPCETTQSKPANLISILNAGMIFKLGWEKLTKLDLSEIEPKIDTLVLRAAEQSIIEEEFLDAYKRGIEREKEDV